MIEDTFIVQHAGEAYFEYFILGGQTSTLYFKRWGVLRADKTMDIYFGSAYVDHQSADKHETQKRRIKAEIGLFSFCMATTPCVTHHCIPLFDITY